VWLLLTLTLALLLAACGGGESGLDEGGSAAGEVEGEFDWKRFDGETIRVVLNQHPWQEAIEPLLPEFTAKTGIKVEVESLPEEQFRQRVRVELTGRSEDLDVFMTAGQNEGALFSRNGWYEDLRPYVDNPSLTSPDYNFEDLSPAIVEGHTFDDQLTAIPVQVEVQMLYYRRDLLQQAGLQVPKTMDELAAAAAKLDQGGTHGFVARGKGAASITQISTYLYNFGGQWTEEGSQKAAFATPEGVRAFDFYGRLIREHGPQGAVNMSWEEALPLFQQGQAAMYTDASTFLPNVMDPAESKVADKAGFAPMPSGPGGDFQTFNGWAVGMSKFSQKKNPSWMFIQWATSPEVTERTTQEGGIASARQSVEFGDRFPADWVETFQGALGNARPQLPQVGPVPEVRDAIGTAVVASIQGKPVEPAVKASAEQFDQIVETSGGGG
jgi:multiple sugar transport system substrate-binding protein